MSLRIILASGSPYRLELLRNAGYDVTACPSEIPEPEFSDGPDLETQLQDLALQKARAVAQRVVQGLILGADTLSLVDGHVLGKPEDVHQAREMLLKLAGTTHEVVTAYAILRSWDGKFLTGVERTRLQFRPWHPGELQHYLESGEWAGKCGAYGLRWPDDPLVISLTGSVSNVIGLPLERLAALQQQQPQFFAAE